jgi:hypothetical protein
MMKMIDNVLMMFRQCFSRSATFCWFVIIVIGMMARSDNLGVTSIIRALFLKPQYEPLNNFFRSNAWKLRELETTWCEAVNKFAPLLKIDGTSVLVGDGKKEPKEGRRMPAVKRMHQESENSSKAENIFGHLFGCVGILAESNGKTHCIPLVSELQDGVKEIMSWDECKGVRQRTHPVEMITLAHRLARTCFTGAILLLDRYFLSIPALQRLDALNASGGNLRAIIMAKSNIVAYEIPIRKTGMRGAPRKKGKSIKLAELFNTQTDNFKSIDAVLYGKKVELRYLSKVFVWGQGYYRILRFVLVDMGGKRVIIASTDVTIDPVDIITLYAKRFSIECTFKSLKQDAAAFSYRFWSKSMPKLNRYAKTNEADRTTQIKMEHARNAVRKTLDAIEGYMFCGLVSTGIMQILSLHGEVHPMLYRYQRTLPRYAASVAIIAEYLRKNIIPLLFAEPNLSITKIIIGKQNVKNTRQSDKKAS